jgi:FkbM family methyltransferase
MALPRTLEETGGGPAAERVRVGGHGLWVRADPLARRWDLEVAEGVLVADEYGLRDLAAADRRIETVLDVGAHLGAFTIAVKALWPGARVLAAEPDPDSAALFRANTADLDDVELEEAAVVGRRDPGPVHLRQSGRANADRNAAASRVAEVLTSLHPWAAPPTLEVRAVDAAALVERFPNLGPSARVDLLKLDCEAAEGEILLRLAEAGLMPRIGFIRGEWHFPGNPPRIERALAATHRLWLHPGNGQCGAFTGEPRGAWPPEAGRPPGDGA